jgi:hypothetical protein
MFCPFVLSSFVFLLSGWLLDEKNFGYLEGVLTLVAEIAKISMFRTGNKIQIHFNPVISPFAL